MRRRLLVEDKLPIKPIEESVAADICLVENSTLNKYIVDGNSYSTDLFPLEQYTPIGVVVVPASHTDDGTARVMSLAAMDYNNPEVGSTDEHIGIAWGGYNSDISTLKNCQYSPRIKTSLSGDFEETQRIIDWTGNSYYLPSDYYDNSYRNPYDTATCYGSDSSYCCPSPYLNDESKNELYSQAYDNGSGIGNRAEQMNGKNNTAAILAVDNGDSTDWQTASTITNTESTSTIHPAAQCCWRYHTVGTNQGDWYLPSAGELGYLAARWKAIDNSIDKLVSSGVEALVLPIGYNWWSSTEYSSVNAVRLYFYNYGAGMYSYRKYYANYVRAFLSV